MSPRQSCSSPGAPARTSAQSRAPSRARGHWSSRVAAGEGAVGAGSCWVAPALAVSGTPNCSCSSGHGPGSTRGFSPRWTCSKPPDPRIVPHPNTPVLLLKPTAVSASCLENTFARCPEQCGDGAQAKVTDGSGVNSSSGSGALPHHHHPWALRCHSQGPVTREAPGSWRLQKKVAMRGLGFAFGRGGSAQGE